MLASMIGPDPRTETLNWSDLGVSELPTGTVTLLLADVEGSTGLWETQPDEMADAVARLDRALTDLVSSHQGVRPVEQGEGDSFVVAFARAGDAVACALKLQQAPLAPIRLRIGVHTGDVRMRDEGNASVPPSIGPRGCAILPTVAKPCFRVSPRSWCSTSCRSGYGSATSAHTGFAM